MASLLGNDIGAFYEYAHRHSPFRRTIQNLFGKAGDVSGLGGAINFTYGAVVYDQLNRESNAHAILKKTDWERSGFRVTFSEPTEQGYGGADGDSIGTDIDYVPTEVDQGPAFLNNPWDLTADAAFRAKHDDGIDAHDWLAQINRDAHAQLLNKEILRSAEAQADNGGAVTDPKRDSSGDGKGLESIDRFIASDAEEDDLGGAGSGWYDIYGDGDASAGDRDSGTDWDAQVVRPDGSQGTFGTNLPFQLKGINKVVELTEDAGADPGSQVFLTRRDTREAFYDELQTHGRYDATEVQAKLDYDGLQTTGTHDGRDISFTVRAYRGRPIVADRFVPSNGTADTFPNGGTGLGHWYAIDQRYMDMQVGFPTLHIEVDNPVVLGKFHTRSLFWTAEQLYMRRAGVQGKMRSVAA